MPWKPKQSHELSNAVTLTRLATVIPVAASCEDKLSQASLGCDTMPFGVSPETLSQTCPLMKSGRCASRTSAAWE